jgi:hypothetical protein
MVRAAVTATAVGAALVALLASAIDTGPLPAKPYANCARDLWPEDDAKAIQLGVSESQVYGLFHKRIPGPPESRAVERCIAFIYDEQILGQSLSLTVRMESGRVSGRWLTTVPFAVAECQSVLQEAVSLKGYYHAMACW